MDKQSKTALVIAFGLVGAFILGAMTATVGIATTTMVARAVAGGPGFVHGGPHTGMGVAEESEGHGPMFGHPGEHGPGMGEWDEGEWGDEYMKGRRGTMPGPRGGFEGEHPFWGDESPRLFDEEGNPIDPQELELEEGQIAPEDARNGARCPVWGTF